MRKISITYVISFTFRLTYTHPFHQGRPNPLSMKHKNKYTGYLSSESSFHLNWYVI